MKKTLTIAALVAAATLTLATFATAQQLPTGEANYAAFGTPLGVLPAHIQAYSDAAVAGDTTWDVQIEESNGLDLKVKSLIGVAVAAQIPCRYCLWLETTVAKANGVTDAELEEAVTMAASVRLRSTVFNAPAFDFEAYKSDVLAD